MQDTMMDCIYCQALFDAVRLMICYDGQILLLCEARGGVIAITMLQ